jgi:large repetitive protein
MKELYLILVFAFISVKSLAQAPANDDCSGAIELTVNANNLCGTSTTGTTIDATLSQPGCNFSSSADDDVWYKFTATANIHKIEVTPITLKNAVFEVLSNTCGSLTSLACVDNTFQDAGVEKTTLSGLTIGQVYFIRVHSAGNFSSVRGTFSICMGVPVPPTNDNCASPTAITINEDQTCTLSTAGNSEDATESLAGCYAGSNADDDVWFSFTATQAAHFIKMTNETIQSPILEIFKGSCGSLESIYCELQYNNNTGFKIGELVPGQTYLIRVYSYYGPGQAGSFSLCVNEPTGMPANDACSGALALTANTASCSTVTAADLEKATGAYDATCVGDKIKDDVWFKFTATDTEMILKMLNHSISSPQMELFSGSCGTLSQVLCADYGFMAASNLTIGQEYYLRVWSRYGVSPGSGGFDLCLSTTALNDDISEVITLQANNDYTCTLNNTGDNLFAVSNLPVSNSYGYCAPLINGAWYKFTALNDSLEISLTPQSNSGPTMEVFHMVSGNPVFLNFSDQKVILTDAIQGDEYYILVYNCTTYPLSRGTYDICIKNIPPPPANDNCATAIALTVNNDLTCGISTEGTTQNALGEPYGCSGSPDDDVWYSFVATATEHQITVTPGTMDDPAFVVYEGSCGVLNELLCENNSCCGNPEVNKVTGLTIGDTYYVQVYSSSLYSDQGTFSICVNLPVPVPVNAECTNPEVISVGSSCVPTSGTNIGVENSTYDNCDFNKYMVWYEFTATTSTQLIHITKGSIANYRLDVFENNCNSLSRVSNCDFSEYNADHDFVVSGFSVNNTYLIAVSTTSQSDAGTFDICLSEIQTPANDECSGAIALTVNASSSPTVRTEGTTQFATESQAACSGNAKDDVWFSFTATQASHRLFFKTINFSGSPVLEVFSGTCGSLVSQQCITPTSYNSDNSFTLLTGLNPSQTYFVRVHNSIGVSYGGTFSIGIASLVAPANDECIGAINIQTASDFSQNVSGNTLDATLSQASCTSGPYADDDVWYKFTANQTVHLIKVQGMSNNSGRIEVYSGSCGALNLLDCGNPSISGDTILKEQIGLQVNSTYFFRIYTSTFSPSFTTFKVAVTNPYISPYDECPGALSVTASNDETCTPTAFSFDGAYTSSLPLNCGAAVSQNDIFLKFTASSKQHQIKISPASYVSGQLYAGTCGSQTLMACNAFG